MTITLLFITLIIIIAASFTLAIDTDSGIAVIDGGKKNETIGMAIVLISMMVIMGGSNQNPDAVGYETIFENPHSFRDPGFGLLVILFRGLGLDVYSMRLSLAVIGLLLINSVVRKYLEPRYQALAFAAYFVSPFFLDVVQVRNFFSMALFVYAMEKLVEDSGRSGIIKYMLLMLIAASIQKMFIIYFPLVALEVVNRNRRIYKILLMTALAAVIFFWCKPLMSLVIQIIVALSSNTGVGQSYVVRRTNLGGYANWIMIFLHFACVKYCISIQESYGEHKDTKIYRFSRYTYISNLYGIVFLPLFLMTLDFLRIQRNLFILNYIVYFATLSQNRKNNYNGKPNIVLIMFGLVTIVYTFFWMFLRDGGITGIILPILTTNWILGIGK